MLKPLRMSDQATTISVHDDAIDFESMTEEDAARWVEATQTNPSAWRDCVKIKDGEQPTEFVIGVLRPDEMSQIMDDCKLMDPDPTKRRYAEAAWRAFLGGLKDVRNWPEGDVPKKGANGSERVDPAWIRKTFSAGMVKVAHDIGTKIWRFNQLTEIEAKN